MRRLANISLSALICVVGVTATAGAQAPSDSAMKAERATMIGRWITQPINITLTADQWKKFDAISHKYSEEMRQIRDQAKDDGDMAVVTAMMRITGEYQPMIRAILTPAQQAVFDKNFQTPIF